MPWSTYFFCMAGVLRDNVSTMDVVDTIYIYDTSERAKQKLPVDVEMPFFLTPEMTSDFFESNSTSLNISHDWP